MGADAPAFVADAYVQHAAGRPGIIFTPTVATALEFSKELNLRGIRSAPVYGAMADVDRRQIMSLFRDGQIHVLVNCMVLTEGFDAPRASCVVIARPTTSSALYVQMVGRVLRPYPGKDYALVLDVVGASQEHKLASLVDLSSARVGTMEPGESLTEAIARQRAERNPHLKDYAIAYQDVNLFEVAEGMWLRTKAGILFITTRDDYYFIWPGTETGRYHVGTMPKFRKGGGFAHKNVSLEFCKKWAEDQAIEADPTVAKRKATWRTKRQEPTENMISFAKQIGLKKEIKPGMTRRELSSLMDIHMASKKLDKAITKGNR
jgi:superfamily II DNA or RNA helicase